MKSNINIDPMVFPTLLTQMGFEVLEEIVSKENHPLKHPMAIFKKHKIDTNSQWLWTVILNTVLVIHFSVLKWDDRLSKDQKYLFLRCNVI